MPASEIDEKVKILTERNEVLCPTSSLPSYEDTNAEPRIGKGASVDKPEERRVAPVTNGRYPFSAWVNRYFMAKGHLYDPDTTRPELERRYKRMGRDFQELFDEGLIPTMDPAHFGEVEVNQYIGLLKLRGVQSGLSHNLSALNQLLLFCDNRTIEKMKNKYGNLFPRRRNKPLQPLDDRQKRTIVEKSATVSNWKMLEAYAVVTLGLFSGARHDEMREAKVEDLNAHDWTFFVRHPKGEGTYGDQRTTPIDPIAWSLLSRYLAMRARMVGTYNPGNEALFPAIYDDGDGYFARKGLQKLKQAVEKDVGFKFNLRDCRRTHSQSLTDMGFSDNTAAAVMGHSPQVHHRDYSRKKNEQAVAEIRAGFQCKAQPDGKTIKSKFDQSGYA